MPRGWTFWRDTMQPKLPANMQELLEERSCPIILRWTPWKIIMCPAWDSWSFRSLSATNARSLFIMGAYISLQTFSATSCKVLLQSFFLLALCWYMLRLCDHFRCGKRVLIFFSPSVIPCPLTFPCRSVASFFVHLCDVCCTGHCGFRFNLTIPFLRPYYGTF